jgi:hypothetical protein
VRYSVGMRKPVLLALVVLGLLAGSRPADAKLLEVYVQAQGGGMTGKGFAGAQEEFDFFKGAAGLAYGGRLGVEFLWVDVWVEHNQFYNGGLTGTWTQFMAGGDWDFGLDTPSPVGEPVKGKEQEKRHRTFGEIGIALGFGVGTGQQVELPLDNGEVSDKGFQAQLKFGVEHRLGKILSLGLTVPVTYGYMFKNGIANDEANHYQSVRVEGLLYVQFHIGWEL